jgi:N-acetylglucosaminyl-diphospho-decaprenol L-rhamnosyltransferase
MTGSEQVPQAAVITVNYHSAPLIHELEQRLANVAECTLYVVDNSGEFRALRAGTNVIVSPSNIGFGRACNLGVRSSEEPILLFINPDLEIDSETLRRLVTDAPAEPDAIWSPLIEDRNGQCSAVVETKNGLLPLERLSFPRSEAEHHKSVYLSGACLCMRRSFFVRLGGFREDIFLYAEDLDLCRRATVFGGKLIVLAALTARHVGGRSSSRIGPRIHRLRRSFTGHLRFVRTHFPGLLSPVLALYLATGRRRTIGPRK